MKYKSPAALEMAVKSAAQKSPVDTNRAIAGFYFHRLLCRVFSKADSPFVLKGGQSILARTINARTTRDIDLLAQEKSLENAIEDLKDLAATDLDDFISFKFDRTEPIKADDEYRSGQKVWFNPVLGAKIMQAISIDLVVDEVDHLEPETLTPADRFEIEGLPTFDYKIYRAENALADKLMAITEIHDGRPSSRVKDLVDIVVYARTCEVDGQTLASCISKEAKVRGIRFQGSFDIPQSWYLNFKKTYTKLAAQAKISPLAPNVESAVETARKLLDPAIKNESDRLHWNPNSLKWESRH